MEELFYQNEHVQIFYLPELRTGLAVFQGFINGQVYKDAMNHTVELYETKKISKHVANLQKLEILTDEDTQWAAEVWFPAAIAAGLRRLAIVISEDVFSQMSIENVMTQVESIDFVSSYFDNQQEALDWLATQPN